MRAVGSRRPLPDRGRGFLCSTCPVSWAGAERDCFHCGLPATAEYTHPGMALQILLHTVGRTVSPPRTETTATNREAVR
jgi:hypothetical protein